MSANAGGLLLVSPTHPLRPTVEACIGEVFATAYGAAGLEFPTLLLAQFDEAGHPVCAAGLRTAADGFFSEAYLDRPIEQVLSRHFGRRALRSQVFEITSLASRRVQASLGFLAQLATLGREAGFGWCVFTAGTRLRLLLHHLDVPVAELAAADPRRLSSAARWGRYYAGAPQVCAVDGRAAAQALWAGAGRDA